MQQMEIYVVILFLSRKKFQAKQIVVLSSSMKLGPGVDDYHSAICATGLNREKLVPTILFLSSSCVDNGWYFVLWEGHVTSRE